MESKIWDCKCCNYETIDKSDYNKHMKTKKHERNEKGIIKETKLHECDKCDYQTLIKANYKIHYDRMHLDRIVARYLCLACKQYMETKQDMEYHCNKEEHKDNVFEKYKECYSNILMRKIDTVKRELFIKKCKKIMKASDKTTVPQSVVDKYKKENDLLRKQFKDKEAYQKLKIEHRNNEIKSLRKKSNQSSESESEDEKPVKKQTTSKVSKDLVIKKAKESMKETEKPVNKKIGLAFLKEELAKKETRKQNYDSDSETETESECELFDSPKQKKTKILI